MIAPAEIRLPRPLTTLVDREGDVDACAALLRQGTRLLTLIGPGGVGKTRLAIAIAGGLGDVFDTVAFVSLASVSDPELVADEVAAALGARSAPGRTAIDGIVHEIGERPTLLVIDNMEGVIAAAPWLAALLVQCPSLAILATSRSRLAVYGEQVYPVAPLSLPDDTDRADVARIRASDAVRLFALRARAAQSAFELTDATAPIVAEICARLDGLPLAIELAAARLPALSPATLLARMGDRLPLLVGGYRDMPERHRALRDAIALSHDLLGEDERVAFRRLAVFADGFTLDAAGALVALPPAAGQAMAVPPPGALDLVAALVDQSLLQPMEGGGPDSRFLMLETIREFGLAELAASGEETVAREAHAAWFLALAETAEPELTGSDRVTWLARLRDERANLHAALGWTLETGRVEATLRLGAALWRFWISEGSFREGRDWLERALAAGEHAPAPARARALHYLGNLALDMGESGQARALYQASLALHRELGDRQGAAASLNGLGLVAEEEGNYEEARRLHEESLEISREAGNRHREAVSLHNLGHTARCAGDLETALSRHQAALDIQRALDDPVGIAYSLWALGEVARRDGRIDEAEALYDDALRRFREVDDGLGLAFALHGLGHVAATRGDLPLAGSRLIAALSIRREQSGGIDMIDDVEALAGLAAETGDRPRAAKWWSAAAAARHARHAPLPTVDREAHDRAVAGARAALGEAAFSAAWATGALVPFDRVVAEALDFQPVAATRPPVPEERGPLSPREVEVLRLIAEGATNHEVGKALSISTRTVATHVDHILTKLDVGSRAAAVAAAARRGIV